MVNPSKRTSWWKLGLAGALVMGGAIATSFECVIAQIVPDTTLGAQKSVVTPAPGNQDVDLISGGATQGANLFHSFEQFSVIKGRTAFFNNAANIQNIISRVTGESASNIDGLLKANGTTNLFLINPNGIIFGSNASLNIGGSFVASTASSLKFADGTQFSATAPQSTQLLTISVPIGLQFGENPGSILTQSQAVNSSGEIVGLQVRPGKTLALVGGDVALLGGGLTAAGGRIELGSVASTGLVTLSPTDNGWVLGYGNLQNFKDIQLSQGAFVDATVSEEGGGEVQVQAKRLTIQDGAVIAAPTLGLKPGGTLTVRAEDSVDLSGRTPNNDPGGLFAQALDGSTGNAGNLTIETRQLRVQDGAQVDASTFATGQAGNLIVIASDSVTLRGTGRTPSEDGQLPPSGLFAQVGGSGTGNAGNLTIETGRLTIQDGAQVSTAGRHASQAGRLTINAADSILLSGTSQTANLNAGSSGLFVSAEPGSIGATSNTGTLTITTGQLSVDYGARISADNFGPGQGGTATLNVRQLIIQHGGQVTAGSFGKGPGGLLNVDARDSVEVSGTGTIGADKVNSTLFTQTQAAGDAGNLTIKTGSLDVRDEGEVSVSSRGSGKAGTLEVQARSIQLDNQGTLNAETTSGNGGDIDLHVQDLLLMRRSSQISTTAGTAGAGGNGGNLDIKTKFIVALPDENSDITANAFEGRGGNINITNQGIFGIEYRQQPTLLSDITASSKFGINGSVNINTLDFVPYQGQVELTSAPRAPELIQGCQARGGKPTSRFVNTGRGGLPPTPYEAQGSSEVWRDVQLPREIAESAGVSRTSTAPTITPDRIVEAQGWIVNANGNVELVAKVPTATSQERCNLR